MTLFTATEKGVENDSERDDDHRDRARKMAFSSIVRAARGSCMRAGAIGYDATSLSGCMAPAPPSALSPLSPFHAHLRQMRRRVPSLSLLCRRIHNFQRSSDVVCMRRRRASS